MKKHPPISSKFPHFLHGGDYNPEQWILTPQIWDEDMRLMKLANCNTMSVGIFSWSILEPEEGNYDFSFLDTIIDKIYASCGRVILATPSGARPHWMAEKYPEVLRTDEQRRKLLFGSRHNHCFTSPVYREKTAQINARLAQRYASHPALIAWHVSNEYHGSCHCPLCQEAFRSWLKDKYHNDLELLNFQWWTTFWSHRYTSWEQIESPSSIGESETHGLVLDWMRFTIDQTADFIRNESAPLRTFTPDIPITTNFMGTFETMNYWKLADVVDVISWDSYPLWHSPTPIDTALQAAFSHDLNRCLKQKPFMLMESTPSNTNWHPYNKLKRPGMHRLSSLQAVAHGSDTVQYFQWRKSRGASEKFHGAVVDHCGHEHTRVFQDVAELGKLLSKMDGVIGTGTDSKVALIYDWENRWAIKELQGLQREDKKYMETCFAHYRPFWENAVSVDIVSPHHDLSKYTLVIAPMLYMTDADTIRILKEYVHGGGTLVCTYLTGYVNENDLCYLGGFPAQELKEVFGLWAEEIDTLYPDDRNFAALSNGKQYEIRDYCELIHPSTAEVLASYQQDFYASQPALCRNIYGKGCAYYIAFRNNDDFLDDFYGNLISELNLPRALSCPLPKGVTAHLREGDGQTYLFLENYNDTPCSLTLEETYVDLETEKTVTGTLLLPPFGSMVLTK